MEDVTIRKEYDGYKFMFSAVDEELNPEKTKSCFITIQKEGALKYGVKGLVSEDLLQDRVLEDYLKYRFEKLKLEYEKELKKR